jgi:formyl-CoA transferase
MSHTGPLTDLRVVEMGQLLAGPFAGQLYADFGAEVIKIEAPGAGDPMRQWGRERVDGKALWWSVVGRGKKSVTVNLREAEGQQIAKDLIKTADILIENFRPGTLERWGMDPETLWQDNPGLIILRVSGFGQTGPMSKQAGYGAIGEAMGGLRYVTGEPDRPPARAGISIGDTLAAIHAALGGMMALHHRERTGKGQVVDSTLYEAVLNVMESLITDYDVSGYIRERTGSILPKIAPSNAYPTSEGLSILIAGNQDTVFARMAAAMGQPELAADERYQTHAARGENQAELDVIVSAWTAQHTAEEVEAIMAEAGVPCGKIYRAPEMLADPHFAAREAIIKIMHPEYGEIAMQNTAPKMSETPGQVRWVGPELGEHTAAVLSEVLGTSADELAALAERGIV